MAIFGIKSKSTVLPRVLAGEWADAAAKKADLDELQHERGIKPVEALKLYLHPDPEVSAIGRSLFEARPDHKALVAVLEVLGSHPSQSRGAALEAIGRLPPLAVESAVEALLASDEVGHRRIGWQMAVEVQGDSRRAYLERVLREARGGIRGIALRALVAESPPEAHKTLLLELVEDDDPRIRAAAMEALTEIRDADVFTLMTQWLAHGRRDAREAAAEYLRAYATDHPEDVREKLLELLASGVDAIRRMSVELLLSTGKAEDVLVEIFRFNRGLLGWLRERILSTLRTFGDDVLRPAVELLTHPDEEVRTAALVLAEEFNDPRLVGPICKLLDEDDWWIRITACDNLGKLGDAKAVPHLIKALDDPDTVWAALDALAQIGDVAALQHIARLIKDERKEVRLEVVTALGKFDDKRMVLFLRRIAETDVSLEVRTRAAEVATQLAMRVEGDVVEEKQTVRFKLEALDRPIDRFLARIRARGASDLHLCAGEPPIIRENGELERLPSMKPLSSEQIDDIVDGILSEEQLRTLERSGDLDFCYSVPEVGRYRANAFHKRTGVGLSFRVIPNLPPTLTSLGIPAQLTELVEYHQGIILITGPAGSGKSTTLAALVNLINETKQAHVITLESPIEFVHPVKVGLINQRDVGLHTDSYSRALKGALRQDPDVIVVGELRDLETMRMCLIAAETGHLVITTMPTNSAVATIDRLVESFPPDEQPVVRMTLADSLKFVVSQRLVRRASGPGRVAVFELLKNTLAASGLIREDKTYQLATAMQMGQEKGMQTVDMALEGLVSGGLVAAETAYLAAEKPDLFAARCSPEFLDSISF